MCVIREKRACGKDKDGWHAEKEDTEDKQCKYKVKFFRFSAYFDILGSVVSFTEYDQIPEP